ncbi:Cof-type HAD-IIB family hydrolase [Ornithinibacillus halotolerans]|uniref:Haloacid dehalogenase n=1 Tax=Ornithinibacillus halotolerans TaxID=1274357 RepID=A0A916WEQ2_9BACI|nr:Cof-type HAD-IIB family hydrolase [Ornithinibacillus halotolerans]GGA92470.1 haloacid dehalogenase [Ornithinibacillus halotolerans]
MNIQAIALDMDGTLLNPEGQIEESLITLLKQFRSDGIKVFLATGRTEKEILDVLPNGFEVDGYVTANGMGARCIDKQLAQHALAEDLLKMVIAEARENKMYYEVHPMEGSRFALIEDKPYFAAELEKELPETLLENELNSRKNALAANIKWVNELHYDGIVKAYFFSVDTAKINAWKDRLEVLKEETDFSTSSSSLHNVEIMVGGVSKATGIELLLNEYGISKENLLAVGDSENDLPMFAFAGHAVAMQNAEDHVKAQADEVTELSYEKNGLYHYLKKMVVSGKVE